MYNTFLEIEKHLLNDEKPSLFLRNFILNNIDYKEPLYILKTLESILQNPKYHPEGNVLNHTMEVVDTAAKYRHLSKEPKELMWAALLHDLGKIKTTKLRNGRWTAYNHDKVGFDMTKNLLNKINKDYNFINNVSSLVKHHMIYLYITKNLSFTNSLKDISKTLDFNNLFLLILSDRLGRNVTNKDKQLEILTSLNKFIKDINKQLNKNYSFLHLI